MISQFVQHLAIVRAALDERQLAYAYRSTAPGQVPLGVWGRSQFDARLFDKLSGQATVSFTGNLTTAT